MVQAFRGGASAASGDLVLGDYVRAPRCHQGWLADHEDGCGVDVEDIRLNDLDFLDNW